MIDDKARAIENLSLKYRDFQDGFINENLLVHCVCDDWYIRYFTWPKHMAPIIKREDFFLNIDRD